jgi:hypothetical protein
MACLETNLEVLPNWKGNITIETAAFLDALLTATYANLERHVHVCPDGEK